MLRRDPKTVAIAAAICGGLAAAACHTVGWLLGAADLAHYASVAFLFGFGLVFNVLTAGVSPP